MPLVLMNVARRRAVGLIDCSGIGHLVRECVQIYCSHVRCVLFARTWEMDLLITDPCGYCRGPPSIEKCEDRWYDMVMRSSAPKPPI